MDTPLDTVRVNSSGAPVRCPIWLHAALGCVDTQDDIGRMRVTKAVRAALELARVPAERLTPELFYARVTPEAVRASTRGFGAVTAGDVAFVRTRIEEATPDLTRLIEGAISAEQEQAALEQRASAQRVRTLVHLLATT